MKPRPLDSTSPTIGTEEAAGILRCGVRTVQDLISTGDLPALELNQRHTVLLREDVIDYVRKHAHEQAKERRLEHLRSSTKAGLAASNTPRPGSSGTRRRHLPDLSLYEISASAKRK